MKESPPRIGELLVRLVAPERDREFVLGDLHEEFRLHCAEPRSLAAARRWYARQAAASFWPLIWMRCRRGEPGSALICGLFLFAGPLAMLCQFWRFALSQVPLRADAPALEYQAASAACVLMLALLTGCACCAWSRESGLRSVFLPTALVFSIAWLFLPELIRTLPDMGWLVFAGVAPATLCGLLWRRGSSLFRPRLKALAVRMDGRRMS